MSLKLGIRQFILKLFFEDLLLDYDVDFSIKAFWFDILLQIYENFNLKNNYFNFYS